MTKISTSTLFDLDQRQTSTYLITRHPSVIKSNITGDINNVLDDNLATSVVLKNAEKKIIFQETKILCNPIDGAIIITVDENRNNIARLQVTIEDLSVSTYLVKNQFLLIETKSKKVQIESLFSSVEIGLTYLQTK